MKTVDKYLFQAMDNYPYSLEETIESLDYAMSYNNQNVMALCLYGRVQMEQLHDYEEAKRYFQEALGANINAVLVYPYYIHTLVLNEDYKEAAKLIRFALKVKGISRVEILLKKIFLLERKGKVKQALKLMKEIKLNATNTDYDFEIDETLKRLEGKKQTLKKKTEKK